MDSSGVKSKISLSFKCSKLLDLDVVSKSDPQVFVELKNGESNFQLIGKTEIVKNNLNPQFTKTVEIPFNFECYQVLKCSVYDIDEKKKEFIGSVTCTIGELYRSPNSTLKKTLLNNALKGYDCGKIEIRAEELANNNDELILNCSASQLDKKDLFGKSDGFLVFYKENKDGSWTAVHKTEVVMNTLNPVWRQQVIPVRVLCNGDFLRKIKVTCFDWNKSGVEDFIGSFEVVMFLDSCYYIESVCGSLDESLRAVEKAQLYTYK
jgi:Ca2+-dependent lipid-binding protein